MKNAHSIHGANFSFYWGDSEAERQEIFDTADALISAAIKGGMKKEDAVRAVERVFSAGWYAGSNDEAYNSSEN